MIKAIWCQTPSGGFGFRGGIPHAVKEEIRLFKAKTLYGVVIMGHNTWESLNRKPLLFRHNIILSDSYKQGKVVDVSRAEVEFYPEVTSELLHFLTVTDKDVWVIGGVGTFKEFAPYIKEYHVSILNGEYPYDLRCDLLDDMPRLKKVHESTYDEFKHYIFEVN